MDCLQLEQVIDGNLVWVFDKDICVQKLVAKKWYALPGEELYTTVHILPFDKKQWIMNKYMNDEERGEGTTNNESINK